MVYDNMEEYIDPSRYDIENQGHPELGLILQAISAIEGPIVDLACGTGRLTLPLAEAGFSMIGIDLHEGMLETARSKALARGLDIEWLQANALNLKLKSRAAAFTMVGNSFQHFLTQEQQLNLLRQINHNLAPDGLLIFDLRFPSRAELATSAREDLAYTYKDQYGQQCRVYYESRYDPVTQIQHNTTYRVTKLSNGGESTDDSRIDLRFTYPQELKLLLARAGFELQAWYGSWNGVPLGEDYPSIVVVCRRGKNAC